MNNGDNNTMPIICCITGQGDEWEMVHQRIIGSMSKTISNTVYWEIW
jgi:hypothetical protein